MKDSKQKELVQTPFDIVHYEKCKRHYVYRVFWIVFSFEDNKCFQLTQLFYLKNSKQLFLLSFSEKSCFCCYSSICNAIQNDHPIPLRTKINYYGFLCIFWESYWSEQRALHSLLFLPVDHYYCILKFIHAWNLWLSSPLSLFQSLQFYCLISWRRKTLF